jgi:hypothetical protein
MGLAKNVIQEDHRLDKASSEAAERLMGHRWHWTLDDSNPDRVSFREYSRAVGRDERTIRTDAHAYVGLQEAGAGARTPSEARERAKMGTETAVAMEAVAAARGIGIQQARQARPVEGRRVRDIARQRAEDHGTSVEEEAPKVAEWIVKSEQVDQRRTAERKQKLGLRFVEMEGKLMKARGALVEALNVAHEVPWGDEERELLSATVENVKALLKLIDVALAGAADVDWDAELAKITE